MSHGNGSMHSMFAEGLVYYTLFFPEDRGQRTEDRGQRTEDRGQKLDLESECQLLGGSAF